MCLICKGERCTLDGTGSGTRKSTVSTFNSESVEPYYQVNINTNIVFVQVWRDSVDSSPSSYVTWQNLFGVCVDVPPWKDTLCDSLLWLCCLSKREALYSRLFQRGLRLTVWTKQNCLRCNVICQCLENSSGAPSESDGTKESNTHLMTSALCHESLLPQNVFSSPPFAKRYQINLGPKRASTPRPTCWNKSWKHILLGDKRPPRINLTAQTTGS